MTTEPFKMHRSFFQDPHPAYARLREKGPVRPAIPQRGLRVWLVTRYDEAKALLADPG